MSSRSGSHAGRGFRYQDAVSAWLAIKCWNSDLDYGGVVPEGRDDAELLGINGSAFVQIKSRRSHLDPTPRRDVTEYIRQLWTRAEPVSPSQLILILEREIADAAMPPNILHPLPNIISIKRLVAGDRLAKEWLTKTSILIAPSPLENSIDLLVDKLGCAPIAASVYFAAIADRIGCLSDENGTRTPKDFLSFSISDLHREIVRLAETISIEDLHAAIKRGYCEPVDFLTPFDDPNFYLGTDIQPGHVAAGLLAERPEATTRVLEALEQRRAALITGPSGSGKSGLMWQTARQSRHTIRWFRIRDIATVEHVTELLRLVSTFRATARMPIGFILDDVGRARSSLWDTLASECSIKDNVLILGSLREEDMLLVARRSLTIEIREKPDELLAKRIWAELASSKRTKWTGWREPWELSSGLLLEYTHLLSQGERLSLVLREQVERRVREKRDTELEILRLASVAGRTGAMLDVGLLGGVLSRTESEVSAALWRLIDEHLVCMVPAENRISSLHQIRAKALAELLHETPLPTMAQTVRRAMALVAVSEIEGFVARTIAINSDFADAIISGASDIAARDGSLELVAAILRGLDIGSIGNTVTHWLEAVQPLNLPKTQLTMAATFAVGKTAEFMPEQLGTHFKAASLLREAAHREYRLTLLKRLLRPLQRTLHHSSTGALTEFLAACIGSEFPEKLIKTLEQRDVGLLEMPLANAVTLLETAGSLAPKLARSWVERVGQDALLQRLQCEMPWISTVVLRQEPEGLAACADIFYISDRLQPDLHGAVIELCRTLLALVPTARLIISTAMAPDGKPAGLGDYAIAQKRIPRDNLLADVLPTRNKRWIAAIAQQIAPTGVSQYLGEAIQLLNGLVPVLEQTLNSMLRGKADTKHLQALGEIYDRSGKLVRPPDAAVVEGRASGLRVADLQSVLNYCAADFLRDLLNLPTQAAAAYSRITEVLVRANSAIYNEPWDLLGDGRPPSLSRLQEILEQARLVVGATGARQTKVHLLNLRLAKSVNRNSALRLISVGVQQEIDRVTQQLNAEIERIVAAAGYRALAACRPEQAITGPWPYLVVNVVVLLNNLEEWLPTLEEVALPLLRGRGLGRRLTIVPAASGVPFPDQAVSGIDVLLPLPLTDISWLGELDLIPAESPVSKTFDSLSAALFEKSAISAFTCATDNRPPAECKALASASAEIDTETERLAALLPTAESVILRQKIDSLSSAGPELSVDYWRQMHGDGFSSLVMQLTSLKMTVLSAAQDCADEHCISLPN
ncbi:hypothetical protein SAMN05216386_2501 [Nitrosospira briensis]|uniref:Uncharacterized protein n=1 Tax=Nitrosospira briensis TaxID=35799 RepID=A0A1I5E1L5_9PROT|nr:hypothetical protein [Nitrosospira briensis]SFO05160.1 hypothetical protein SAMN05216386_2501 [Nitrosospira briensis]